MYIIYQRIAVYAKQIRDVCEGTTAHLQFTNKSFLSVSYSRTTSTGVANNGSSESIKIKVKSGSITCQVATVGLLGTIKWKDVATVDAKKGSSWKTFEESFLQNGCVPSSVSYIMANSSYTYKRGDISYPAAGQMTTQYTIADNAGDRAINYLSGMSYDDLKLSPEEKVALLQYYLDDYCLQS